MKTLLLISVLFVSLTCQAQYRTNDNYKWQTPKLYIPTAILGGAFITNQAFGNDMSYQTRTSIALTSILVSGLVYAILPDRVNSNKYKRRWSR